MPGAVFYNNPALMNSRIPPGNFWAAVKSFFARGGFVNGLNPTITGRIWYVNTYVGADGNTGRAPDNAFLTMARALEMVDSYDIIVLDGVVREQLVAPVGVYEVSIIGGAGIPRQATDGGVPTGGGSTWMAPASGAVAATPLLQVVRQGWSVNNILFNPHTSSAAIRLTTAGGLAEAGQFSFNACTVLGGGTGQIGVEDNGGSGFVQINNSIFKLLTGTALLGLNTAVAVPLSWQIKGNDFSQNTNDIKMSLSYGTIKDNTFHTPGAGAVNKVISTIAVSGQGGFNSVSSNYFNDAAAGVIAGEGYSGAATDQWMNFATDAVKFGFV